MDFINTMVAKHIWGSLIASHVFIAAMANIDRIIKLALTYFSAKQIDSAIDAAAEEAKTRVDADAKPS